MPQAYERTLSLRLDLLVIALESAPCWNRRAWLRFQKLLAERRVPAFRKQVQP
jgi:hypothetical protein